MNNKKKNKQAFTLMEIMITVVLIGIIAGFAIPNYSKAINKAYERDAIVQLSALHAACQIYKARTGDYYTFDLNTINDINSTFKINITSNIFTYEYVYKEPGLFYANAKKSGTGGFTVKVTQDSLNTTTNPCCQGPGTCPSLSTCPP